MAKREIRSTDPVSALKAERRKARELRRHLKELTETVARAIAGIDAEFEGPGAPRPGFGERLSLIRGVLEYVNDCARHFGLDEEFPLRRPKGTIDFDKLRRQRREFRELMDRADGLDGS